MARKTDILIKCVYQNNVFVGLQISLDSPSPQGNRTFVSFFPDQFYHTSKAHTLPRLDFPFLKQDG